MTRTLILPGLYNSDPGHWQSRWEARDETMERVIQDDWETPHCADWVARLGPSTRTHRAGDLACGAQRWMRAGRALGSRLLRRKGSRSASGSAERPRGRELSLRPDRICADAAGATSVSKCCSRELE